MSSQRRGFPSVFAFLLIVLYCSMNIRPANAAVILNGNIVGGPSPSGWYWGATRIVTPGANVVKEDNGSGRETDASYPAGRLVMTHLTIPPSSDTSLFPALRIACLSETIDQRPAGLYDTNNSYTIDVAFGAIYQDANCNIGDTIVVQVGYTPYYTVPNYGKTFTLAAEQQYRYSAAPAKPTPKDAGIPDLSAGACSLSDGQLVQLDRAAGFSETQISTMVAIQIAESKGVVNAVNRNGNANPVSYDIGLSQVNDIAHPTYDRIKLGVNPIYNANAAHDIYTAASSFQPWSTFNNKSYIQYLTRSNAALRDNAAGVLPLEDCKGSLGNPSDPANNNPGGANGSTNQQDYCGISFNPLNYLKCLFIPGPTVFNGWTNLVTTAQNHPPLSVISGIVDYMSGIQDGYASDSNVGLIGGNGSVHLPGTTSTFGFNPLVAAGNLAKGGYQDILKMIRILLWLGFAFFAFKTISRAFGSKETGGDTE